MPRATRFTALPAALVAGAALCAAACQLIAGLERATPEASDAAPPAPDALGAADVADAGEPSPLDVACGAIPPPPSVLPDTNESDLVFAFSYITTRDAEQLDAATPLLCPILGFNLDGADACTTPCTNPTRTPVCDPQGGIDNEFARFLTEMVPILTLAGINVAQLDPNVPARLGRGNILVELTGYNGGADDVDVTLTSYLSSGLARLPDDAGPIDYSSPAVVWDAASNEAWSVDTRSLVDGGLASRFTAHGYVANHVLVVGPTTLPAPYGITIANAWLTALIAQRADGAYELHFGRVGAKVPITSLLDTMASVDYNGLALCFQPPEYGIAKQSVCSHADISIGASQTLCNAMSFGSGFVGVPATIAPARPGPLQAANCPQSFADDCDFLRDAASE